ncbi:MAG: hypothetical protein JWN56_2667 [Sphingobacteriales bacterium]|nr:hypothetical protein [Sphingobacteriales bacterium]
MKLYKLDLLTLLVSLFILSGCQNQDGVGLEVDPANAINGYTFNNTNIKSQTVPEGVVNTLYLQKHPLGDLTDDIFGKTNASLAVSLKLPSDTLKFGTEPELDSAVLILGYAKEFTGDSTTTFKFDVHQLNEKLTTSSDFSNTTTHAFNPLVIGTKTGRVNFRDSVKVTSIVTGGPDVTTALAPHLRIPISGSFIKENFLNGNPDNFKNNYLFSNFIKGLQISMTKVEADKVGGITLLDFTATSISRLELYYKSKNDTKIDTIVTSFTIQNLNATPIAATIIHTFDGTDIKTQLDNPQPESDITYVQSLAGVRTKLNITNLQELKDLGNIIINKAELVIPVPDGTYNKVAPATRIYLYTTDIAGQRAILPDNAPFSGTEVRGLSDLEYGGYYDATTKNYKFIITSYLQDIIRNKIIPYDLYLSAADPSATGPNAFNPYYTSTGRTVLGSGKSTSTFKIKLNVMYTKVN